MSAAEELNQLLLQETIDGAILLQWSRRPSGFQTNELRRRVWPKLLGMDRYQGGVTFVEGLGHRDFAQVKMDVERSFQNVVFKKSSPLSEEKVLHRRRALERVLMTLLTNHPGLYYYQGLNDIFGAIILVLEDERLAYRVCEVVAMRYLVDFMQPDFKNLAILMKLIFFIIYEVDTELYTFLREINMEPYFATSWIVTWLSHDLKELSRMARLIDAIVCSVPLYILYLSAAIVLHFKNGVLKCYADIPAVHSYLGMLSKISSTNLLISLSQYRPKKVIPCRRCDCSGG